MNVAARASSSVRLIRLMLVGAAEESLQRVLPLKERLARTDKLIDQVVYRLYGLTEEEIRVVERREG